MYLQDRKKTVVYLHLIYTLNIEKKSMPKEDQLVFLRNAGPVEVGGSTQGPSWGYVKVIF